MRVLCNRLLGHLGKREGGVAPMLSGRGREPLRATHRYLGHLVRRSALNLAQLCAERLFEVLLLRKHLIKVKVLLGLVPFEVLQL